MDEYERNIIPQIEAIYDKFTALEKKSRIILFTMMEKRTWFLKNVAKRLFVSKPPVSRFAQKCGFTGYREFLFRYQQKSFLARHPGQAQAIISRKF